MRQLLSAEHLKMKRTMVQKLLFLAPVSTIAMGFLAGPFFYACAFNWWYTMFLPILLAVICVQIQEKEKKKLDYRNVYMSPITFQKIWSSKALLVLSYSLFCCVFLSSLTIIMTITMGITMKTSILSALLAGCIIPLTCAYQIPLYMFLAKRFNFMSTFLSSIVFIATGLIYAEKTYWLIIPSTWCNRAMYPILRILKNGLLLEKQQEYLLISNNNILLCICMSIGLFFIVTFITGQIVKREVHKKCH